MGTEETVESVASVDTATCFYCRTEEAELCEHCGLVAACPKCVTIHRWWSF